MWNAATTCKTRLICIVFALATLALASAGAAAGGADTKAPTKPSGLTITQRTATSLTLSWKASSDGGGSGLAGYDLYLSGARIGVTQQTSYTFTSLSCGKTYTLGVDAYDRAGNRSEVVKLDASTSACPTDTSPPTTPTLLAQTGSTVSAIGISWNASLDNVGVAGYTVYVNGSTAGTSAWPGYTVGSLTCGTTYTLAVDAYDAAGNRSSKASVIGSTSPCLTTAFTAAADAAVEQDAPTSTLGGATYLRTDSGGDPAVESYLRFSVSGLNGTIQKAILRVHAQGDPTVDGPAVYAAGDSWTESTINWNTRPPHATTATADSGAIASYTWVNFDVTSLVGGAGTYDFALVTGSSDGVNFDSRETSNPPQLVITTSGDGSTAISSATDTQAPTAPTGLNLSGATATSVSLGWTASTDNVAVAGYDLFLNGNKAASTTTTGYTFSGLTCGTSYTLAVQAYDAAGNRSPSSSVQASTSACADTVAPTTPTLLTETGATGTSISLSWSASLDTSGVVGYTVYVNGAQTGTTTWTTYTIGSLACGTSYTLAVDAYDAAGNHSAKASVIAPTSACTTDTQAPAIPSGLTLTETTTTSLSLAWKPSTDNVAVAGYDVYLRGSKVGTTTGTSYSFANLTCSTGYTLAVDAYDAAGNRSAQASLSATTSTCPATTSSTVAPPPAAGSWTLKFSDDFDGTSLDLTKWRPNWLASTDTAITKGVDSAQLDCEDPAQSKVSGGVLSITAVQRSCLAINGITYNYASDLIESYNHFQFTYGYMEARMFMPVNSSGTVINWPGFWADGTGTWPSTGEIDVMEVLGGGTDCWHFHYSGGGPGGCPSLSQMGATSYGGWHTFGADWEPGEIDFYYDGHKVGCVNNGATNGCLLATVTSSPMYLIADLAISTQHGGPLSVPATVDIDYIRVWQH